MSLLVPPPALLPELLLPELLLPLLLLPLLLLALLLPPQLPTALLAAASPLREHRLVRGLLLE